MLTAADVEPALRTHLPGHLHHLLPQLADLLADTVGGTAPVDALQATIPAESELAPALRALMGRHITVSGIRISFSADSDAPLSHQTVTAEGGSTISHVTQEHNQFFIRLPSSSESRDARSRKRLLAFVKEFWIDGVLGHELHKGPSFSVRFAFHPDATLPNTPFGIAHRQTENDRIERHFGTSVTEVFDRSYGQLLILGAPGAGKTTLLLELCRTLLARAERDHTSPIPVVLTLSSWRSNHCTFAQWLSAELGTHYRVPRRLANSWISRNRLLPLLDGLDEVTPNDRQSCINAINECLDIVIEQLAVTSRFDDFNTLATRLHLRRAIVLEPLSQEQVDSYLVDAGATSAGAHAIVRNDPALQQLIRSPLMLSLFSNVYSDVASSQSPLVDAEVRWRDRLLTAYVQQMLSQPTSFRIYIESIHCPQRHYATADMPKYSTEEVMRWLAWIAQILERRNEVMFYLERIQPTALAPSSQRLYYLVLAGLLSLWFGLLWEAFAYPLQGVALGFLSAVGVVLGGHRPVNTEQRQPRGAVLALTALVGALIGFYWGTSLLPTAAPPTGIVGGIAFGIFYFRGARLHAGVRAGVSVAVGMAVSGMFAIASGIGIPEYIAAKLMRVSAVARVVEGLSVGMAAGVIVGAPAGLFAWLFSEVKIVERLNWSLNWRAQQGLIGGVVLGILVGSMSEWIVGLVTCLSIGLLSGFFGGLTAREVVDRITPNQGIWLSAKNALVCFGITFVLALFIWAGTRLWPELGAGQHGAGPLMHLDAVDRGALRVALIGGSLAALIGGFAACLQHIVLRCFLSYEGAAPWRYIGFLDHATNRGILRKVGGGYMFLHKLLLDHFAAMKVR